MRLGAYVFLLFSLSVMCYLFGYPSILLFMYNNNGEANQDLPSLISNMAAAFLNPSNGLALLAVAGLAVSVLAAFLGGGYIAIYLVPMIILVFILNFVIFPLSFIFDSALPTTIKVILVSFFNLLTILAGTSFVRGSV